MVCPFALNPTKAEPLGREAPGEAVCRRTPDPTQAHVLLDAEPDSGVRTVELERSTPKRREVIRLVDFDHGAGRLMDEIDREQEIPARRRQDREITFEASVDRAEPFHRSLYRLNERRITSRLRDAFQPDVALLAEPIERLAIEHDTVLCRRPCERHLNVAVGHRAIVAELQVKQGLAARTVERVLAAEGIQGSSVDTALPCRKYCGSEGKHRALAAAHRQCLEPAAAKLDSWNPFFPFTEAQGGAGPR